MRIDCAKQHKSRLLFIIPSNFQLFFFLKGTPQYKALKMAIFKAFNYFGMVLSDKMKQFNYVTIIHLHLP
jgi:hypothetical protein